MKKIFKFGVMAVSLFCVADIFCMESFLANLPKDEQQNQNVINEYGRTGDVFTAINRIQQANPNSLNPKLWVRNYKAMHDIDVTNVLYGRSLTARNGTPFASIAEAADFADQVNRVKNTFTDLLNKVNDDGTVDAAAKAAFIDSITDANSAWKNGGYIIWANTHAAVVDHTRFAALRFWDANHVALKSGDTINAATGTLVAAVTKRIEIYNAIMNVDMKVNTTVNAFAMGDTAEHVHAAKTSTAFALATLWNAANQDNFGAPLGALVANDAKLTDFQFIQMFCRIFGEY